MSCKKTLWFLTLVCVIALTAPLQAANYPSRDLQGIIMWGAGGGTDGMSRALTPNVEPHLGNDIVLVNKPGGTGAIATQHVYTKRSDGYTLLFGAENPQNYGILGLSKLSYDDFFPVTIMARSQVAIVANIDKPWASFKDLVADAQAHPGKIKMGTTGPGGVPYVVGKLVETVTGFDVASVPFKGDGPGITALLGGHIDFIPVNLGAASEHIRAGRVKALAVLDSKALDNGDFVIPPITQDFPAFDKYVPWAPFFGVWCKKDVPQQVKDKLVAAFAKGVESDRFNEYVASKDAIMMNISGDEADAFLHKWRSVTAWLLHDAGATKISPADLGIPRP